MFWVDHDELAMALKPMSCPCHVQIFNKGLRSWRGLPIRYAEFGACHRNEPSDSLHGITRTRAFEAAALARPLGSAATWSDSCGLLTR